MMYTNGNEDPLPGLTRPDNRPQALMKRTDLYLILREPSGIRPSIYSILPGKYNLPSQNRMTFGIIAE